MTRLVRLSALLVALILVAGVAHAQTSVGTIEGTVSDEQGAILPGVTATLTGPRGAQTVVTDEKGQYRFISVQPGTYTLKVELGTSFAPQSREVEPAGRLLALAPAGHDEPGAQAHHGGTGGGRDFPLPSEPGVEGVAVHEDQRRADQQA